MASCTATRKVPKPISTSETKQEQPHPTDSSETINSVLSKLNTIRYNTFSGKIDVSYNDSNDKDYNFDVKLNIQNDEFIWMSVTGPLGFEIARVLITKDSVKILNKFQKQYIAANLDYLQTQLGLPLDLETMQNILIGNPVFINAENSSYIKEENNLIISSQTKYFQNFLTVALPDYLPQISKLQDVDVAKNRSAILSYSDYKNENEQQFSKARNIKVNYKTNIEIILKYKSYTFNGSISNPFSVPSNYKKIVK